MSNDFPTLDKLSSLDLQSDVSHIADLISALGLTRENSMSFWKTLLTELQKDQEQADNSAYTPFSTQTTRTSLIHYIQQLCDGVDIITDNFNVSKLYDKIKNSGEDEVFWHEELQNIIKLIEKLNPEIISPDGTEIYISEEDIQSANAAKSFINAPWTAPQKNFDGIAYEEIRKNDYVVNSLRRDNKLQKTSISSWLKLLMPQYGRRVEIEDLDRNFWVIGQTIDTLCNFTLNEDGTLIKITGGIREEIAALWENCIHLWITQIFLSQKKGKRTTLFLPILPSSYQYQKKYDNFDNFISQYVEVKEDNGQEYYDFNSEKFEDLEAELIEMSDNPYPLIPYRNQRLGDQLCILPYFKLDNYQKNYYSGIFLDFLYVAIPGSSSFRIFQLKEIDSDNNWKPLTISIRCEQDGRFSDNLYFAQLKNDKYYYGYPFSKAEEIGAKRNMKVYAGLDVQPEITFKSLNGIEVIDTLEIKIYDAVSSLVSEERRLIGSYKYDSSTIDETTSVFDDLIEQRIGLRYEAAAEQIEKTGTVLEKNCSDVEKAFYLGDLISWKKKTAKISDIKNIFKTDCTFIKIGNFMPELKDEVENNLSTYEMTRLPNGQTSLFRGDFTLSQEQYTIENEKAQIVFYEGVWNNGTSSCYLPELDSEGATLINKSFAFSAPPTIFSMDGLSLTKERILANGLKFVKFYLLSLYLNNQEDENFGKPQFLFTGLGLTPFQSGAVNGHIGWNSNVICHGFYFLPHPDCLLYQEDIGDNYKKTYNSINAFQVKNLVDNINNITYNVDGIVLTDGGEEIGKIIGCYLINKYDSYYDGCQDFSSLFLDNPTDIIFNRTGGGWRALRVVAALTDTQYCDLITTVDNDNTSHYSYNLSINPENFIGKIEYYDGRYAEQFLNSNGYYDIYDPIAQVSIASIVIETKKQEGSFISENGTILTDITQVEDGSISTCDGTILSERVSNQQKDSRKTGLITTGTDFFERLDTGMADQLEKDFHGWNAKEWVYVK